MALAIVDWAALATYTTPLGTVNWNSGSGPPSGNMIVAFAITNSVQNIVTPTSGATWNTLFNNSNASVGYAGCGAFWKVSNGSEGTGMSGWSFTGAATGKHLAVVMLSISGANTALTPLWAQDTGSSSPFSTTSVTPTALSMLCLSAFGVNQSVSAYSISGYTSQAFAQDGSSNNCSAIIASRTAGLTTDTTTAQSATATCTGTVAAINGIQILIFNATAYNTLTAGLSFSGKTYRLGKHAKTSAVLSFTGATIRTGKLKVATATLGSSGFLKRMGKIPFPATLHPTSSLLKKTFAKVGGSLSFSGKTLRGLTGLKLSGSFTPSGSVKRLGTNKVGGAGMLSFSGAIKRQARARVGGSLSFLGRVVRLVAAKLPAGSLSFTGAVSAIVAFACKLTAGLTFSGKVTKKAFAKVGGNLSFAGNLPKKAMARISAVLGFGGSLYRGFRGLTFSATLGLSGYVKRTGKIKFNATLPTTASFKRMGLYKIAASLLNTGGLRRTGRINFLANLYSSAKLIRQGKVPIVASLLNTGVVKRKVSIKLPTAGLTFSGITYRIVMLKVAGATLSFAGAIKRRGGAAILANMLFAGNVYRRGYAKLNGNMIFSGAVYRQAKVKIGGSLPFSGKVMRTIFYKLQTASLSFSGAIKRRVIPLIGGQLSFSGLLKKRVTAVIPANLSFIGNIYRKGIMSKFSAGLSFAGHTARTGLIKFNATLYPTGLIKQVLGIIFQASIHFQGAVKRKAFVNLSGGMNFFGFFYIPFPGAPTFTGTIYVDTVYNSIIDVDNLT